MDVGVAVHGHKEVHVHTVGQVTELVKFVDSEVLQVCHLQHINRSEVYSQPIRSDL